MTVEVKRSNDNSFNQIDSATKSECTFETIYDDKDKQMSQNV